MPIKTCTWVRARLPLMAGGDSLGLDRWVVEGHLVRCDDCRRRLQALHESQAALRSLADPADDPAGLVARPLWPDLSRRLRQSRRPRPRTAWGFQPRRAWLGPAAGLAAGLLAAASIVGLVARHDPRNGTIVIPIDHLLSHDPPRLLKPEDPDQFERRRTRPQFRPAAPYEQAHASVVPDSEPEPDPSPPHPTIDPRPVDPGPPVELTQ